MPVSAARPALVIFDCDGVLVDSEPIFLRVLHRYLLSAGTSLSHSDCCARFIGKSKTDVEIYLEEQGLGIPGNWPEAFYSQAMVELERDCKAVEGVQEVVVRYVVDAHRLAHGLRQVQEHACWHMVCLCAPHRTQHVCQVAQQRRRIGVMCEDVELPQVWLHAPPTIPVQPRVRQACKPSAVHHAASNRTLSPSDLSFATAALSMSTPNSRADSSAFSVASGA